MDWFWFAFVILFIILDLMTDNTMLFMCFAIGGFAAHLESRLGYSVQIQLITCFAVTLVGVIITYIFLKKKENTQDDASKAAQVAGQVGVVSEEVNGISGTGVVKVRGVPWKAYAEKQETVIPVGAIVKIINVEGCHLTVRENAQENAQNKEGEL